MKWWQTAWPRLLAGTGLAIVWVQFILWAAVDRTPSDLFMAVGFGMLYPAARKHVKTVLGGGAGEDEEESGGGASLPSPSLPPPSPPLPGSSSLPGGTGEPGA